MSSCLLGWAHLRQLRTEAIKALGVKLAAVAPGLRLALLLCHEQCDPGFYQVWNVCQTFRRLARKRPMFLQLWQNYMDQYNGDSRQGPFAKLLELCNQLRWTIEAPRVCDHGGVLIDWLDIDERILYDLLQDAWLWKIFREVSHRKDMEGLNGINWMAVRQAHQKAPAHHRPFLARLQDGTLNEPT